MRISTCIDWTSIGFLAVTCWHGVAIGGAFRLPDQDASATARGEAFVATADNPAAIYYNPAGITQMEGHSVRAGVYGIWYQSSHQSSSAGVSLDSKSEIHPVPQLFYTFAPEALPVAFGLGLYSPYGLSQEWSPDAPFRTNGIEGSLTYLTVNPVVAWEVRPGFSIAAGLTGNYAETDLKQGIAPVNLGDSFRFKGDGTAIGFNAGLLWKANQHWSVGVNYRSETSVNYSGTTEAVFPGVLPGTVSSDADGRFTFPQNVVAGLSWRPTTNWNLEINVDWTDWDRVNSFVIQQPGQAPIEQQLNWRSSFYYEFGVTHYVNQHWSVSGGYIYNEDSVPDENFNPLIADVDKHFVSVGGSYWASSLRLSFAYQFGYGPSRTVSGGTSADGEYDFLSHAVFLTAGWQF